MKEQTVIFMPHPPIIIPSIGGGKESLAKDTIHGMDELGKLVAKIKPETIIFITPHGNSFDNGTCILDEETIEGNFTAYGYPEIRFSKRVNQRLSKDISQVFEKNDIISVLMDCALAKQYQIKVELDNGVMVPMYFIDKYYVEYDIVHITPGDTSLKENYILGQKINEVVKSQMMSSLIVCSGDLSHTLKEEGPYDFHPSGPIFDHEVQKAINSKNPVSLITLDEKLIQEAGQCGLRSFLIGFGFLDATRYDSKIYSYEGPYGVGYLTGSLISNGNATVESILPKLKIRLREQYKEKISKENDYIRLARLSIESYVKEKRKLDFDKKVEQFSNEFIQATEEKSAGVFVSIHSHGALRGCIGTIYATQDNIIEEIIYNSISACNDDPRFDAVEPDELFQLDIKVDILMEPELIQSKEKLDVLKYGVIVEKGSKRGVLLPNLEGIETVDQQIQIAINKAGISNESGISLYRFRVIRHERK